MKPRVNRHAGIWRRERDMGVDGRHGLGADRGRWLCVCVIFCVLGGYVQKY